MSARVWGESDNLVTPHTPCGMPVDCVPVAYVQGDSDMRLDVKRVVDTEGQSETSDVVIQWMYPEHYRVGVFQYGAWEYTDTVDWNGVLSALSVYVA